MKLEPTPNPTMEELMAISDEMEEKMERLTPENCPYFSCSFAQTGTQFGANIAACDTIQVFRAAASNVAYGVEKYVNSEAVERPDFIIAASSTGAPGEARWTVAETHFFVGKSGAICFRADGQNWALVEAPQNFRNKTRESEEERLAFPFARVRDVVAQRNQKWDVSPPDELRELLENANFSEETASRTKSQFVLPSVLPQKTFIEAKRFSGALSDGRDGRDWKEIEGALALLHNPAKSKQQIRFEPNPMMLQWWGLPTGEVQMLYDELARLDFDDVILFHVVLSAILHNEKARCAASLDDLIKLIGRDGDARKSAAKREEWRRKVWRAIVIFDSMAVFGARPGKWKEPGIRGEKRAKMDARNLYSRDPLLRIVGTRDTEQGSFDGSAPPKEVSIVPGEWLMQHHGNREILSELGNICQIAQISRGRPSGAWAACAGVMLNQLWREEATRAQKNRTTRGEAKVEVLKFRAFTRRELLANTLRSDYDVDKILNDPTHAPRARRYWEEAINELKRVGIVSYYTEGKVKAGESWREEWLDQPLDIRPKGETLENALTIHKRAEDAKRRGRTRKAPQKAPEKLTEGDG